MVACSSVHTIVKLAPLSPCFVRRSMLFAPFFQARSVVPARLQPTLRTELTKGYCPNEAKKPVVPFVLIRNRRHYSLLYCPHGHHICLPGCIHATTILFHILFVKVHEDSARGVPAIGRRSEGPIRIDLVPGCIMG
jgi:hypothetical protein